jgi:subtilisin family serine protease
MRRFTLPLIVLLIALVWEPCSFVPHGHAGFSSALTGNGNITFPYVPGEVLVRWKRNASVHSISQLNSSMNMGEKKTFHAIGVQHLRIPPSMRIEDVLAKLRGNPLVEYAEPNYIIRAVLMPNDPQFLQLWGLHNTGQTGGTPDADIDAPEAWDIHRGSSDVVIAVIDSGVAYHHPDLDDGSERNIWTNDAELNGFPGVDDDGNGYVDDFSGWDFVGEDNDPTDYLFHGTHVAGTIAAIGNNATGITGVNWLASIMPLRIFGASGFGDTAKAIEAIFYAVRNGASVINASWGGDDFSQVLYDAISYANETGCLFVAAAGNSSADNDAIPFYPASYDLANIISVAATDHSDTLAAFSNYGATSVDVGAPGVNILSPIPSVGLDPTINTLLSEDFDSGLAQWTSWGKNNAWGISDVHSTSAPNSLADSPSGNYLNGTDSFITYNTPFDLVDKIVLMDIQLRRDLEPSNDWLFIGGDLGGGNGFLPVYLLNGDGRFSDSSLGSFNKFTTNISPLGDLSNAIRVGFNLYSNASVDDDGVYIDDVVVTAQDLRIAGYMYWQSNGTSMAAPQVSGLAGLILARYPGIGLDELKGRIFNGVDVLLSLNGKVLTGGRINAHKSLGIPVRPTDLSAIRGSSTHIDLTWSDNSDPAFNEDGFRVERRKGTSGNYQEVAAVGQDVTTYSDPVSEEGAYYYRIRAYNSFGASSYSNEATPFSNQAPLPLLGGGGGGGCFIATAAFGSPLAHRVQILRDLRDRYLLSSTTGKSLIALYHKLSPPIASLIAGNEVLRPMVRIGLYPLTALRYIPPYSSGGGIIVLFGLLLPIMVGVIFRVVRRSLFNPSPARHTSCPFPSSPSCPSPLR